MCIRDSDKTAGIGAYSYADFKNAVQYGIRKDGAALYPAMPYPSYAIMPDRDIQALYAYFMADVAPVDKPSADSTIPWPLNMRWPMACLLYTSRRPPRPACASWCCRTWCPATRRPTIGCRPARPSRVRWCWARICCVFP